MKRILGLDVGDRYIGVAVSDLLMLTAQGVKTIVRKSLKEDFEEIENIISKYDVKRIVVGLPYNMDGTLGEQGKKVKTFTRKLSAAVDVEIVFSDERMTSIMAEKTLIEGNVRREDRKKVIDKLAAVYILQNYLDGYKE